MAKPLIHAENSVRKFGGKLEDYTAIHNEFDSPKQAHASVKHRAIYHSSFGIWIIEKIFGIRIKNSDGHWISVRDVAEQHVLEDMGFIPSLDQYLNEMNLKPWMAGLRKKKIELVD